MCAVSPLALKASASILFVNLCCVPSCPAGFSFHFVCKCVPYPLLPRGVQLLHVVCKFVLNSLLLRGLQPPFCIKNVPYPLLPRGLQLPFCMQICAVSPLAQRASDSILYAKCAVSAFAQEASASVLYVHLCRIPSCPQHLSFHFVCKFVPYPLLPGGLQLPFCM
jgi:hypothetical protein